MESYLVKSAIIMAVLLGVYFALLQREKMYRFNRYYLLGTLVLSLVLPLISIPVYVESVPVPEEAFQVMADVPFTAQEVVENSVDYRPVVLLSLYMAVTLFLTVRFVRNLMHFRLVKRSNSTMPFKEATLVLINDGIPPHTFFSNIFVSRADYENRHAEPELFTHELAHVNQYHTFDVLFAEIIKTLMWFNPLLYVCKHAIQLNHEFLADEATIKHHQNITSYQHLLLGKSHLSQQFSLASSINFSITKKRFIMMTKTTSKNKAILLKLLSLPVLALLLITLSTKTIAQQPAAVPATNQVTDNDRDEYYSGVRVKIEDKAKGITINKMYEELTKAEKDRYMFDVPARRSKKQPTAKEFESYKNKKNYAIWIDNKNVDNSVLNKYKPEDFALTVGSFVHKNARTKQHPQQYQFTLYTHAYYDKHFATFHYPGDTYQMNITKEFKNGKEVAGRAEIVNPEGGKTIISANTADEDFSYTLKDNAISKGLKEGAEEVTGNRTPSDFIKIHATEPYDGKGMVGYNELSKKPEYPGGIQELLKFVSQEFGVNWATTRTPKRYYVQIVIENDGTMSYVKVHNADDDETSQKIAEVLKQAEKWEPAEQNGNAVRASYHIPFTIK